MIKKIAWNTFKNTGNVNTFLELKQIQNLQQITKQEMEQQQEEQNGNNQNKWYNNI